MSETPFYQGEPVTWDSRDTKERARKMVVWALSVSFDYYRKLRRNFNEYFDLYTNQPLKLRQTNRIRSNVPSGRVPEMVDTYVADLQNQIMSKRPVVGVIPQETGDIETAAALEQLLQYDMDNWTEDMGPLPAVNMTLLQACLWGSSPSKTVWTQRVRSIPMTGILDPETGKELTQLSIGFQGPIAEPLFLYDVHPHPQKVWPEDHYPVVHVSFKSYDELLALKGIVYDDDVDLIPDRKDMPLLLGDAADLYIGACGDVFERADQRVRLGWSDDSRLEPDGIMVAECECMFRPKVDWTDTAGRKHKGDQPVRTIITVANGLVIRVSPGPLPEGMSVYQNAKISHLPGQWYGIGLVQKNRPQVHVEDTILNMVLQNLAQTVNKPKIVIPQYLESGQSLDDQPGGVIRAKMGADVRNIMREIPMSSIWNDAAGILSYIAGREEGVGGATELKQGRVPDQSQTATASNIAIRQSSIRFALAMSWIGATFFRSGARKAYYYNRDYLQTPFAARVLGEEGQNQWFKIQKTDFINNVDFVFLGPQEMESENLRIAQLQNFLKVLSPLMQAPWTEAPMKETIILLADKFKIPNIERLKQQIGYGAQPAPAPQPQGASPGGGAPAPVGRADRRLGSGGPPTDFSNIAKSLGGMLAGATNPGPR